MGNFVSVVIRWIPLDVLEDEDSGSDASLSLERENTGNLQSPLKSQAKRFRRTWNWGQWLESVEDENDHLAYGTYDASSQLPGLNSNKTDRTLSLPTETWNSSKLDTVQKSKKRETSTSLQGLRSHQSHKIRRRWNWGQWLEGTEGGSDHLSYGSYEDDSFQLPFSLTPIVHGIRDRVKRHNVARNPYKHEKLSTSQVTLAPNGKKLQLIEVKSPKGEGKPTIDERSVPQVKGGFTFPEGWERICSPGAHTCLHCQSLRIDVAPVDPKAGRQSQALSFTEIAEAADGGCVVFDWLLQMLGRKEEHAKMMDRYFTLSLVPNEPTNTLSFESNDLDEFEYEYHGSLGAFGQDDRHYETYVPHRRSELIDISELGGHASELTRCLPLNVDVASEENLRLSRDWLSECHEFHSACRGSNRSKLPSRVLDISNGVKLIETGREYDGKYAVLSYCWGCSQPIITTIESRPQWKEDIPFNDLPQTIKDAIITTRGLGLQYLWVDSLCIIQDDVMDQMNEIPLMSDIYHGAYVTISAASAITCRDGFLHKRTPQIACVPCVYSERRLGVLNLYKEFDVAEEPIHKRAWTLQEHVLSCRILEYGTQQLRRICRGDPGNVDTSGLGHYDPAKIDKSIWVFRKEPEHILKHCWRPLIRDFTSRGITNAIDRPRAIQGIVNEYAKVLKKPYLAGLWGKDFLVRELLWQRSAVSKPVRRPENQTVPSWSWLAVEGTIVEWREWPSNYGEETVKILDDSKVNPHPGYHDTSRRPSSLKMRGRLRKALWIGEQGVLVSANGSDHKPVAKMEADALEAGTEIEGAIQVETLEVLGAPKSATGAGLVLISDGVNAQYRRAGIFWTSGVCDNEIVRSWMESGRDDVIRLF